MLYRCVQTMFLSAFHHGTNGVMFLQTSFVFINIFQTGKELSIQV